MAFVSPLQHGAFVCSAVVSADAFILSLGTENKCDKHQQMVHLGASGHCTLALLIRKPCFLYSPVDGEFLNVTAASRLMSSALKLFYPAAAQD